MLSSDKQIYNFDEIIEYIWPVILKNLPKGFINKPNQEQYNKIVSELNDIQLRSVTQELFSQPMDDVILFHPHLVKYSVSNNIPVAQMLDWIKENSPVTNFNILRSIRRTLVNGIIKYNNDIKPLESESYFNLLKKDTILYIAIDGDNLTSTAIPYYKSILLGYFGFKIFMTSYFGLGVIPYYIDTLERLYKREGKYYVSSYSPTKEAADVDLSYNIFNAFFEKKNEILYIIVSNDRASVEIRELILEDGGECQWLDPFPVPDERNKWYPFDILSSSKYSGILDSALKSLRDVDFSFGSSFLELITRYEDIPQVNTYYTSSINILKRPEVISFKNFYDEVDRSLFLNVFEKLDVLSQYLVLTGTKFFTYKELRDMMAPQVEYILRLKKLGIKIIKGDILNEFLNTELKSEILDIYKVFNMREFLYFNTYDLRVILDLGPVLMNSDTPDIISIIL